jgi:hypothetical protein
MDGRLTFFNALAKALDGQTSNSSSECVTKSETLQLTVIHKGGHHREVEFNFSSEAAAFLHTEEHRHGVDGPFTCSADGTVVTRSRDGKQFTPEELAKGILDYLRGQGKEK